MHASRREFLMQLAAGGVGIAAAPRSLSALTSFRHSLPAPPPELKHLRLLVQTRAQEDFDDSTGSLRLFSGATEIRNFGSPPPAVGKVKLFNHDFPDSGLIDRDAFVAQQAFLRISGSNHWFPRLVFLFGETTASPSVKVPLAVDLGNNAGKSLRETGGTASTLDRWPLQMLTPGATTDPHELLLLWITTSNDSSLSPQSAGPLEIQIFSNFPGDLLYHTTLTRVGSQDPAEVNGEYLAVLPINPGAGYDVNSVKRVVITNRSDDAWIPHRVEVFSLSAIGLSPTGPTQLGRHLGSYSALAQSAPYVSQDPTDVRGSVLPLRSIAIACSVGP